MSSRNINKIVVFGPTGQIGLAAVEACIKRGYSVTMFMRDPTSCPKEIVPAAIIQGDVLNKEDVDKAIAGQDAVIVAIGTRMDLGPTTMMSEGAKNIASSMSKHGVKRVAFCTNFYIFCKDSDEIPQCFVRVTEDHVRMTNVFKESNLEWVAVCPPYVTDEPARGDYKIAKGEHVGNIISTHDLAEILISCITEDKYLYQEIGVGYPE